MRYMIISDDNIVYTPTGHIQAFITGALLDLGVRGKELKELVDTIEDIYLKAEHVDLGDIIDYVFDNQDKLGMLNSRDWLDEIVKEQW
jgi:hypothetical protein